MTERGTSKGTDEELLDMVEGWVGHPLKFAMQAFPWGEAGTVLEKYPDGPDTWQREVLQKIEDGQLNPETALKIAVASGHGVGKATANKTLVDTPDGVIRWGDVKVGDRLFGADGKPVRVIAVPYRGERPCYKVTFDDGSSTICGQEHLWTVKGRQQRRKGGDWVTMETQEILARGVKRSNGCSMARQWEIPVQGAVVYEHRDVNINPYVMGLMIGDGCASKGVITTSGVGICEHLDDIGVEYNRHWLRDRNCYDLYIKGRGDVRYLGRSEDKYIPDDYKYTDIESRKELLRGLIDTDGEVNNHGSIVYSTVSEQLRDDVLWLVRSLGGKASVQPTAKKGWYIGKDGVRVYCKDCYRIIISLHEGFGVPCYVEHKAKRVHQVQRRYLTRWIDSIEYVGEQECTCVTVDRENGLYLCNDFIVTHNSCLVAIVILYCMNTMPHLNGIVTANTEDQLKTKTFYELNKWYDMMITKHWFKCTGDKIYHLKYPKTWFCAAVNWSEDRTEAFAGQHAENVLVIYDEASAIPDSVWEVSEGAMTTPGAIWLAFGNPTRNDGRFYDCFESKYWDTMRVDSRTCKMTNKKQLAIWEEEYGEDSDFFRVRVRGLPPSKGDDYFFSAADLRDSYNRIVPRSLWEDYPLVIGVDVAGGGGDSTVISYRKGKNEVKHFKKLDKLNELEVAKIVRKEIDRNNAKYCCIDTVGIGHSVSVILKDWGYENIIVDVDARAVSSNKELWGNMRAELHDKARKWIKEGHLEQDDERHKQFMSLGYDYGSARSKNSALFITSKTKLKKSPDMSDSFVLTMAIDDSRVGLDEDDDDWGYAKKGDFVDTDYDVLNHY